VLRLGNYRALQRSTTTDTPLANVTQQQNTRLNKQLHKTNSYQFFCLSKGVGKAKLGKMLINDTHTHGHGQCLVAIDGTQFFHHVLQMENDRGVSNIHDLSDLP